jgi:hypothetical protein
MTDHGSKRTGTPTNRWLRESAAALVKRVEDRGMILPVETAEAFLAERHLTAAAELGAGERSARQFLDDDTLDELADHLVGTFADEEPGSNLFILPRTAHMSVASFGRLIAGLAETIQFLGTHRAIDDADRRARIHETAQLLSLAGLLQADHTGGPIAAPPAMFSRIARTLTTTADMTDNTELAAALRRDAMRCAPGRRSTRD